MGAPIKSFTRISEVPIVIHSQVYTPQIVVVLDPTLLSVVDICEGLPTDGVVLINSQNTPAQIRKQVKANGFKLFTVDATSIAIDKLGKNIPNTPMLGALVKATGIIELDTLIEGFREEYAGKFKDDLIQSNILAIKEAYKRTKKE